jgi:hypothetical protein
VVLVLGMCMCAHVWGTGRAKAAAVQAIACLEPSLANERRTLCADTGGKMCLVLHLCFDGSELGQDVRGGGCALSSSSTQVQSVLGTCFFERC